MKNIKLISALLGAAAAATLVFSGCGLIKYYPTSVLESSSGNPVDNATFPFEAGDGKGLYDGFTITTTGGALVTPTVSTEEAYAGKSSLKLACDYPGPSTAITLLGSNSLNLANKTLTVYVWVPNNMFNSSTPYGVSVYLQLSNANGDWYQGPGSAGWQNLSTPGGNVPGLWNQISVVINDMILVNGTGASGSINGNTMTQNGVVLSSTNISQWGIKIAAGSVSGPYNGAIYVDSISIQ